MNDDLPGMIYLDEDNKVVPMRRTVKESKSGFSSVGAVVNGLPQERETFAERMARIRARPRPTEEDGEYRVPEPPRLRTWICPNCKLDTDGETTYGSFKDKSGKPVPCPVCSPPVLRAQRRRNVDKYIRLLVKNWIFSNEQNLPSDASDYSFGQYPKTGDTKAKKAVQQFASGSHVEMVLVGGVGRGKTGLAISATREIHAAGEQVLFMTMEEYIKLLQANFDKEDDNNIRYIAEHVDILVIDDLGVERPSAFTIQETQTLIDRRHKFGLRTLITTNYTLEGLLQYWHTDLGERAGFQQAERTISRIEGWYKVVTVGGSDLRKGAK